MFDYYCKQKIIKFAPDIQSAFHKAVRDGVRANPEYGKDDWYMMESHFEMMEESLHWLGDNASENAWRAWLGLPHEPLNISRVWEKRQQYWKNYLRDFRVNRHRCWYWHNQLMKLQKKLCKQ